MRHMKVVVMVPVGAERQRLGSPQDFSLLSRGRAAVLALPVPSCSLMSQEQ